jgi:hypothetical protein
MWAEAIARSYWHMHWPMPSEIGSQYILLLLIEMQKSCMLRLPYRAKEIVPPDVAALFPQLQQPNVLAITDQTETKPKRRRKAAASS